MRLSQCMIVKNEESNIERALSWGRGIVHEQIVVDTGSDDRTAEIAETMGAKVFHFEWVDDFAAAKNYALEQASGDWVAFLDADEYMKTDDAQRVISYLESIPGSTNTKSPVLAVRCPLVNLTDKGKPDEMHHLIRFFKNSPSIRFAGRIHEQVNVPDKNVASTNDFRVLHTGYSDETIRSSGKAQRNIQLLRQELKAKPGDVNLKAYLAQALQADSTNAEATAQIDKLYSDVLARIKKAAPPLRQLTYEYFMDKYMKTPGVNPEAERICGRAYKEFPEEHKNICYRAMAYNKRGNHSAAYEMLIKIEPETDNAREAGLLTLKLAELYARQMLLASQGMGDTDRVLKYAQALLMLDKKCIDVLRPYIALLMSRYESVEKAFEQLARVYDMSSKHDLLLIAHTAKECGAIELARRIIDVAAYLGTDN